MSLYALSDIDDAIDATRVMLLPIHVRRWAKLAVIVFFIGGISGMNPLQFGGGSPGGSGPDTTGPVTMPPIGESELAIIAAIFAFIGLLAVVFLFVGSVMEFVFVESLRREAVSIRRYSGRYWRPAVRLFGFRLVIYLVTIGIIGGLIVVVLAPIVLGVGEFSFALLAVALPIGMLVAILSGLIHGFTTVFIVPIMMIEDRGLLSAWRRLWPTLTGQWKQYGAYAVMGYVLQLAGGLAATLFTLVAALIVAIPLGLLGLLGAGLRAVSPLVGWAIIAIAAVIFVLAVVVLVLFSSVPVQTFLRYYALLVLGDTNTAFDLIADRREAIRDHA